MKGAAPVGSHSLGGFVGCYPNALTPGCCAEVIEAFEAGREDPARRLGYEIGGSRADQRYRRCLQLRIGGEAEPWVRFVGILGDSLVEALTHYRADHPSLGLVPALELCDLAVVKYAGEPDHIDFHCDNTSATTCSRVISAVWYLNSLSEGGEIEFPYQGLRIQPRQGTLLLFPSGWTHPHRALAPRSGPKYVIIGWCELRDLPRGSTDNA
jgi:hypothetical protein